MKIPADIRAAIDFAETVWSAEKADHEDSNGITAVFPPEALLILLVDMRQTQEAMVSIAKSAATSAQALQGLFEMIKESKEKYDEKS